MRDWLRKYGLTVGIFAAVAFIASLVAGIAAGNPFGTIIVRAILAVVLFGAFGAGARYVMARFLLTETPPEEGAARPTIDIVLPEERPDSAAEPAEELEEAEGAPAAGAPDTGGAAPDGAPLPEAEPAEEEATAVDELPEIAALEPEDELDVAPDAGSLSEGPMPGASRRAADAARDRLAGEDAATLARALRTVLKREER